LPFDVSHDYSIIFSKIAENVKMEDEDIAAAMGFSSFGSKKKRKFDQAHSPPSKDDSSGANSTPLGVRLKIAGGIHGGEDAIGEAEHMVNDSASILESTEAVPPPATNAKGKPKYAATTGLAAFLAHGQSLPDKPIGTTRQESNESRPQENKSSPLVSFGGPLISKAELNVLRQGITNEKGDVAIFLPSFVEDPWEKFDRSRG
jgi:hypothetical protein